MQWNTCSHSFSTERVLQRERVCQLLGLPAVLEETGICSVPQVSTHALEYRQYSVMTSLTWRGFKSPLTPHPLRAYSLSLSLPPSLPHSPSLLPPVLPSHYRYPQCLHFLDLLQSEHFRRELANAQCTKFIEEQQLLHWHYYTKRRMQFQEKLS